MLYNIVKCFCAITIFNMRGVVKMKGMVKMRVWSRWGVWSWDFFCTLWPVNSSENCHSVQSTATILLESLAPESSFLGTLTHSSSGSTVAPPDEAPGGTTKPSLPTGPIPPDSAHIPQPDTSTPAAEGTQTSDTKIPGDGKCFYDLTAGPGKLDLWFHISHLLDLNGSLRH